MKRWIVLALALTTTLAKADFTVGFEASEGYNGSAGGTSITGQNGWYLPPVGGVNGNVMTYVGNAPGFVHDPHGGEQFLDSAYGNGLYARSQHAEDFSSHDQWTIGYDFAALYSGQGASLNNIGSFSLQDSTKDKYFIALNTWMDPANPTSWQALYNVFDASGNSLTGQAAGAAWQNLAVNHWYRQWTSFNLKTNIIDSVSIEDITTGTTTTVHPTGWYLAGGANSTLPNPTDIRFFGGGQAGNNMGWDNVSGAVPEPGSMAALGIGLACLIGRKRKRA